ncbi:HlyD family efflux transporter periplasmic adaptor subunit [Roseomonas sp. SSH11]|uniref:HlyD family efflux transporter periplasmic adaptor subunit n=1 Tax=Pararoseomonas baculiformis TaxID=2820812 RepID=A0ABS4AA76_9PROT|nr:HlyD family efflux transporter periplasmic adaptor subunit [Pararoseomonas baculiformis]MBP0443916.1 HlyD family efflux transporter periplasmic adaptor subunit [Pararoseomonas baculiformis]
MFPTLPATAQPPEGASEPHGADAALDRLAQDYRSALDSMADGVLTVGPDGRISTLNRAGADILACDPETAIGGTLQSLLPEDGSADAFFDAVLEPVGQEGAVARHRVEARLGDRDRHLEVTSRAYRIRIGPQAGRLALTAVFSDVTELARLSEAEAALNRELREQHAKLQAAYLQLEQSAERLRTTGRRLAAIRWAATIGVFALFVGAGLYAWEPGPGFGRAVTAEALPSFGTLPVTTQPVSLRIAVVGVLDAGSLVSVVAPFDGLVRERNFRYGNQVERGTSLIRLDVNDVEVRLREARSALIRARQKVEELRGWTTGQEVSRARRQLSAAEMEANDIRARLAQTKILLDRGIVPAEEYRTLQQQQRNQQLQLQAARADLEATLARGDSEHLRIAEFEMANAEVKVRELESDLGSAVVSAPVTGVVLMPPDPGGGRRAETMEPGSRVTRGQAMFTIGDLESFQVRASVDEIDVGKVRVGQPVSVTGDAFPGIELTGRVTSVAAQASGETSARTGMPVFGVTVAIENIPPEERRRLSVGMSANLSIIAYDNPEAIVLPPDAIRTEGEQRVVQLRDALGAVRRVPVRLGISTPGGIEIREGLSPGDTVVLW